MLQKKRWEILSEIRIKNDKSGIEEIIPILLANRGLKTKKEIEDFLHPKLEEVTIDAVSIDKKELQKACKRIQKAIDEKEQIVVFGDYDVDGITGTAILWETLHALGASVLPYIPHRIDEGYGLSTAGISNIKQQASKTKATSLIITVDNGIVANDAVEFASQQGIDVIITDHHARSQKDPNAYAIVHTTKLCGAGVGWLLAQQFKDNHDYLDLVALATIADLVPLVGANRMLVKFGLEALQKTHRVGLRALFKEAAIDPEKIGVYEVGHIIGPRLNAMGRMESAMDSLRLLCTKDESRAKLLAEKLGRTNRERQVLTQELTEDAITKVKNQKSKMKSLLFIQDEKFEEGVIGLVAGKLVERYYRPAIVVSRGQKTSKASARSVAGVNIIEFIRSASHLLINAGGHPMAAGFTVETEKLVLLQEHFEKASETEIAEELLQRTLKIDCELSLEMITQEFYDAIQALSPFGMANPEPVFVTRNVIVSDLRRIGQEGKHLKLELKSKNQEAGISAIAFGMGELFEEIKIGDAINIVYTIDENEWRGNKKLQVKMKDIKISSLQ